MDDEQILAKGGDEHEIKQYAKEHGGELAVLDTELVKVIEASGLERTQAEQVLEGFKAFFEEIKEFENEAKAIVITDATQVSEMKRARELRLKLKNIRVNAEKVRKERKEFFLRGGKAIDGLANVLKALVVPLEEHLDAQENYAERMEAERKDKANQERIEALRPYVPDVAVYNLRDMTDGAFEVLLANSKKAFEDQKKAEEEAEKKRQEEAEAKRLEDERIRKENEQLKAEKEKADAEKAEADRKAAEAEAEKKKAEDELKRKQEEEDRKKREAEEAEKREAEEKAKREKADAYRAFRAGHGWTEETKEDYYEKVEKLPNGTKVVLFKKVGEFNLD